MAAIDLCKLESGRRECFVIAASKAPLRRLRRNRRRDASLCGNGMPKRVQVLDQREVLGSGTGGVEGILIWVIRYEAKRYITARVDFDDVAAYGRCRGVHRGSTVNASVGCGALYYLEVVAVDVERMAARVKVVDHHFNCVEVFQHMGVGGVTVHDWVGGIFSDTQSCIE